MRICLCEGMLAVNAQPRRGMCDVWQMHAQFSYIQTKNTFIPVDGPNLHSFYISSTRYLKIQLRFDESV